MQEQSQIYKNENDVTIAETRSKQEDIATKLYDKTANNDAITVENYVTLADINVKTTGTDYI